MSIPRPMETSALLAMLRAAYPDKQWVVHPADSSGNPYSAITLSVNGHAIHDPFTSSCGRFSEPPLYGLIPEHARELWRHNLAYGDYVTGAKTNVEELFEIIVLAARERPEEDAAQYLEGLGFCNHHTGGGCMSYARFDERGWHVLVTDAEGTGFPSQLQEALIGLYDNDGEVRIAGPVTPAAYRAAMETRHFSFEAYGASHDKAMVSMKEGLRQHGLKYSLPENWYSDDDIKCYEVRSGVCYRDGEPIPKGPVVPLTALPLYMREFPDFGELDVQLPEGFEDTSWHNDVCPSWTKELHNGTAMRIWIEYREPDRRESPDSKRFVVQLYDAWMDFDSDLIQTDDYAEVERFIATYLPKMTAYQFLRNTCLMSREQLNAWYEKHVGYRPDVTSSSSLSMHTLRAGVAEMMFYHAGGIDVVWSESRADSMLETIASENKYKDIHERRYACVRQGESTEAEIDITAFMEESFTDRDRFTVAKLKVGETACLTDAAGVTVRRVV